MEEQKKIQRIFPLGFQWETRDPFLFCVHHLDFYPEGNEDLGPKANLKNRNLGQDFDRIDGWNMYHGRKVPGFPVHPHRGFETVTVVQKGIVDHADSMGASGRYGNGDVQWMTAGSGVQHSEMFPLLKTDEVNTMELFQIWLNLPSYNKMVDPYFTMFWKDQIPQYELFDSQNRKIKLTTICGKYDQTSELPSPPPSSWATPVSNEVMIWIIELEPNAIWKIPSSSKDLNRSLYFYEGSFLVLENLKIPQSFGIEIDSDHSPTIQNGDTPGKILILQGKPIGEPVVQYGPFVMNTAQEIQKAFDDYRRTDFGGWDWDMEQVHGKEQERFAKHPD